METSRDRGGSFSPQLVKKGQTILGNVLEDKLLWLWALGLSYTDISGHIIEEMYGKGISEGALSSITASIISKVKEWKNRPLAGVYAIVWLDAKHFQVKEEGCIVSQAV